MPINAGAVGIQPVSPQRPAGNVDGVHRRGDGASAGFRPQTEITLKTAIEDLAATLGRISAQEKFGVERLPANIGQVVRNILQQSLSMEETLAQGIGSTIESQRFSTEQLAVFARMLAQIGALAEKGFSMELSDETRALLTAFKNLVVTSEGGRSLEPVLLTKAAFELVDAKTPEEMPVALQEFFAAERPSAEMRFLKSLVEFLMPRPAESAGQAVQAAAQGQQQSARPTATQQLLGSMYRQFDEPYSQATQTFPRSGNAGFQSSAQQNAAAGNFDVQNSQVQSNNLAQASSAQTQQMASNQQTSSAENFTNENPSVLVSGQNPAAGQTQQMASNQQSSPAGNFASENPSVLVNGQNPSAPQTQQTASNQQSSSAGNFASENPSVLVNGQNPASAQTQQMASNQQSSSAGNFASENPSVLVNGQNSAAAQSQQTASNQQSSPAENLTAENPSVLVNGQNSAAGQSQQMASNQQSSPAGNFANENPSVLVNGQNSAAGQSQQMASNQQSSPAGNFANENPSVLVNGQNSAAGQSQQMASNQQSSPAGNLASENPSVLVNGQNPSAPQTQQTASNQQSSSAGNLASENPSVLVNQNRQAPRDDFAVKLERNRPPSVDEEFLSRQLELKAQMQLAKTLLLQQPLQNTPQTMDALKNLAQFLIRNPSSAETMTPREQTLLQNFVNNQQTVLPRDEARHLQNLLRLCQQNVPAVVQQAAVQQKLPNLPRLWAFMQLCDMANLPANMSARSLKRAGREVSDFANAIRQTMSGDNTTVQNQRSFQMMLPLYLGENQTSYPTYLSVYDESERDKDTGVEKKETWLRICVLTDNIGAAELVFRVYEKTQLDMRFYFSEGDVAEDFKNYVGDLRNFIGGTNFSIGEIRIGSVGEKMLMAQ